MTVFTFPSLAYEEGGHYIVLVAHMGVCFGVFEVLLTFFRLYTAKVFIDYLGQCFWNLILGDSAVCSHHN